MATREIVRSGSGIPEESASIVRISLNDRRTVATTHSDQSKYAWDAIGGLLVARLEPSAVDTVLDSPLFLDDDFEPSREISGATWYSSKQECPTMLVYLDGYVIKGCWDDNSVTVVPVPRIESTSTHNSIV